MKLSEFADVYSGQLMSRISLEKNPTLESVGSVRVFHPKAIEDGDINLDGIVEEEIVKKPADKYFIDPSDIVMKLIAPYDAVAVYSTDIVYSAIIPSFCCIIRFDFKSGVDVPTNYLLSFLQSKNCKEQLAKKMGGKLSSIIKVSDIRDLDVPFVGDEDMMAVVCDRYKYFHDTLNLFKKACKLEQERIDAFFSRSSHE